MIQRTPTRTRTVPRTTLRARSVGAGVLLCLAILGTGLLVSARRPASSAHTAAPTTAGILAQIPAIHSAAGGVSATDQAIAEGVERARRSPENDRIWTRLGDMLMQKVRETANASYYGYAEAAYHKALALNPQNGDAVTGMAWVTSGRHEFDKSVAWANQAIALDAQNNVAYGLLGDANVERGEYDAAFDHYQKMLDIRPDISSYSRGAHLLFLTGDTRKAIWLMERAIKAGGPFAENTAWCRAQLAQMLFDIGALLPAEQVLKDGLAKTPRSYHLLAGMGRVKTARRDYAAAIGYYEKSLAIAPEHNALVALGDLYRLTGKPDQAEAQYARVEQFHAQMDAGSVPHTHLQLAQFNADHDRNLIEALRMAEPSKLTKNVLEADTVAWCYYKNGQYAEAKTLSDRALQKHTPNARFLFHAGMIAAKQNEKERARQYLYRALSLNPYFSPIDAPVASETLKKLG